MKCMVEMDIEENVSLLCPSGWGLEYGVCIHVPKDGDGGVEKVWGAVGLGRPPAVEEYLIQVCGFCQGYEAVGC